MQISSIGTLPSVGAGAGVASSAIRKDQRRAQMSFLLINKFRNKFGVKAHAEAKVDKHIEATVYQFLMENKSATENGLRDLD